jgi:hypothetical protein
MFVHAIRHKKGLIQTRVTRSGALQTSLPLPFTIGLVDAPSLNPESAAHYVGVPPEEYERFA